MFEDFYVIGKETLGFEHFVPLSVSYLKDVMGELASPVVPDYLICFFAGGSCISDVTDFLL